MVPRVFIDGHVGTTGLRIRDWLVGREDLEVFELPEARRKDAVARSEALASADLAVLCLPDDASREAVALAQGTRARILDASSAHRVTPGWVFGLPRTATVWAVDVAYWDGARRPTLDPPSFEPSQQRELSGPRRFRGEAGRARVHAPPAAPSA